MVGILVGVALLACAQSDLKSDEEITFCPSLAWRTPAGDAWEIEVHAWVYEPERGWVVDLIRKAMQDKLDMMDADTELFKRRVHPFFYDNERRKHIEIQIGDRSHALKPTSPDGHSVTRLRIPADEMARLRRVDQGIGLNGANSASQATLEGRSAMQVAGPGDSNPAAGALPFRALLRPADPRQFTGVIFPLDAVGVSVVSDIDDTIRVTNVRDRKAMFRSTFCRPFVPVAGMADLYLGWAARGVAFHYVSAGPWQLFAPLDQFIRDERFPTGSFHLRPFRWQKTNLFEPFPSSEPHKRAEIGQLLERYPYRHFVLVGDTGERDPEIYADIARRHPTRVMFILIRNATGESSDSARIQAAFRDVSPAIWRVFTAPQEIESLSIP